LFAAVIVGVIIVIWWKHEQAALQEVRNDLLARRRAVLAELGDRWFTLRDNVEAWTRECASAKPDEEVVNHAVLAKWDFRSKPGIYFRLGAPMVADEAALREAAQQSLHDGFTACLLKVPNPSPVTDRQQCATTAECPAAHLCNDLFYCSRPSQPFNLRIAYRAMSVLDDEWVAEIQDISRQLTMQGAVATFDSANKYEIPMAIDLLARARYFLVVVDEPAEKETADAEALTKTDAGIVRDRSIPTAAHDARICLWRLDDEQKVLSVRRRADGVLIGGTEPKRIETRVAKQQQANSCALAFSVREALGDEHVPKN